MKSKIFKYPGLISFLIAGFFAFNFVYGQVTTSSGGVSFGGLSGITSPVVVTVHTTGTDPQNSGAAVNAPDITITINPHNTPTGVFNPGPNGLVTCSVPNAQATCTVNFSWSTQNVTSAQVWVSAGGGAQSNTASSLSGSASPNWITTAGDTFYLYNCSGGCSNPPNTQLCSSTTANPAGGCVFDTLNALALVNKVSLTVSTPNVSNSHNVTVASGTPLTFNWSSANGASASSSYTVTPSDACGNISGTTYPWGANTLNGSTNSTALGCQIGSTYNITYKVVNSSGQTVSDTVILAVVAPAGNGSCTNGAVQNCTLSGGGAGSQTCSGNAWGACTPTASQCGTANGQSLASAPSGTSLCATNNTASSLSTTSSSWSWTCTASSSVAASCSATNSNPNACGTTVPGTCTNGYSAINYNAYPSFYTWSCTKGADNQSCFMARPSNYCLSGGSVNLPLNRTNLDAARSSFCSGGTYINAITYFTTGIGFGGPSQGWNWQCGVLASDGSVDVSASPAWCSGNVAFPTSNLAITDFHFTDIHGNSKTSFLTGERVFPSYTVKNISSSPVQSIYDWGWWYDEVYPSTPTVSYPTDPTNPFGPQTIGIHWSALTPSGSVTENGPIAPGQSVTYSASTLSPAVASSTAWTAPSAAGVQTAGLWVDYPNWSNSTGQPIRTTSNYTVVSGPDFTISVTPAANTINPGDTAVYQVTLGSLGGFSGDVNLSIPSTFVANSDSEPCPPGATCTFTQNPVHLTSNGTAVSYMTVVTTSSTPPSSVTTVSSTTTTQTVQATDAVSGLPLYNNWWCVNMNTSCNGNVYTSNGGGSFTLYTDIGQDPYGFADDPETSNTGYPYMVNATSTINISTTTYSSFLNKFGYFLGAITATGGGQTHNNDTAWLTINSLTNNCSAYSFTATPTSTPLSGAFQANFNLVSNYPWNSSNPNYAGVNGNMFYTDNPSVINLNGCNYDTGSCYAYTAGQPGIAHIYATYYGSSCTPAPITINIGNTPDVNVSVTPLSYSTNPGNAAVYSVTVSSVNGYSGQVLLNTISGVIGKTYGNYCMYYGNSCYFDGSYTYDGVSGCPTGTTCSYANGTPTISPGNPYTTILTVATNGAAPTGTYNVVIGAAILSSTNNHNTQSQLVIGGARPPTVVLESPAWGSSVSGQISVAGYAVPDPSTTIKKVEFYVQSTPTLIASSDPLSPNYVSSFYGIDRSNPANGAVLSSFSTNPSYPHVGFSDPSFNTGALVTGNHTIIIKAYDNAGGMTELDTPFTIGAGGPSGVTVNPTGGGICNSVTVNWNSVSGSSGYNVYRSLSNSFPGSSGKIASNVSGTSYADSTGTAGQVYYYWVTDIISGVESSASTASGNPVGPSSCTANLSASDKDIIAVNGANINYVATGGSPQSCNQSTDVLPSNTVLALGDKLSFKINICNNSNNSNGTASSIVVTDSMINLATSSPAGWNMCYNGSGSSCTGGTVITQGSGPNHYIVSGSVPNQVLTIDLSSAGDNVAQGAVSTLTFDAKLSISTGFSGNSARFQNSFSISYNNGNAVVTSPGGTPLLPFYSGSGTPVIKEVP